MFVPMFAIWYFLVIRPQQQQRRKLQTMLANLKTGDRVVTSGGTTEPSSPSETAWFNSRLPAKSRLT